MNDITVQELKSRLDDQESVLIVDVREPWEFEEANVGGATNIPLGELPHRLDELQDNQDQEIVVYCQTGGRSGQAKIFMSQKGFTKVRNLLGGIKAYLEC